MGPWQQWTDTIIAKYPYKLVSTSQASGAVAVCRKILSTQPDTRVTIVTLGFLTNLPDLLQSQPDSLSTLAGKDHVVQKVKRLVSIAGVFLRVV